jgi:hypothetical protein
MVYDVKKTDRYRENGVTLCYIRDIDTSGAVILHAEHCMGDDGLGRQPSRRH